MERAKDALQSLGDGGLYGTEQEKNMFYTYILRSISQPEQRYIGSTSDLKSRLAIRRFFASSTVCDRSHNNFSLEISGS